MEAEIKAQIPAVDPVIATYAQVALAPSPKPQSLCGGYNCIVYPIE